MIHSRGTLPGTRRTIALLAKLRGRPAHLVLLNADRASAEAGQRRRGRTVSQDEMDRQVERWHALMAAGGPAREGWNSVQVLDRQAAARVDALVVAGDSWRGKTTLLRRAVDRLGRPRGETRTTVRAAARC